MSSAEFVYFMKQALSLIFWVSLPPIAVASIVGTLFSLFQALTQIQEQTLSFGVKLVAVFVTLLLGGSWMAGEIQQYSIMVLGRLAVIR